ncbi:TetR/AcrR family transcriptional regulator [Nocardia aurea]|nr:MULTISPECIES: TetR/AcrR family transcriptional regulator [Nocardia]
MAEFERAPSRPAQAGASSLRKDAERNRERVVEAARRTFAREGLSASMASVAREAGVGIATLFRRFPTRDDLIAAVFADRMDAYTAAVLDALSDTDPWGGFRRFVQEVCSMQAADRGFADVLTMTFPGARDLECQRSHAYHGFLELVERAKATGRLRPDFTSQDLVVLLMANAGVIAVTHDSAPDAWRRLVAYMIQAFETRDREGSSLLPPAPDPEDLQRAMFRDRAVHDDGNRMTE